MLHIFHGDDAVAVQKELKQLKDKWSGEIVRLDGSNVTLTELKQAIESRSLFGADRLVIIDNLLTTRLKKTSKDKKEIKVWIKQLEEDSEIVFAESKILSKTQLGLFPKSTDIAQFRLKRSIFRFLDALEPGATRNMLMRYDEAIKQNAVELMFTMIVRQFRLLLMVKYLDGRIPGLSSWQISSLKNQAQKFSEERLIAYYRKLLDIDVTIKSGKSSLGLEEAVRYFLITI